MAQALREEALDNRVLLKGRFSAWLVKEKSGQRILLSSQVRRYCTIDFNSRHFLFEAAPGAASRTEAITFDDIVAAEHHGLPPSCGEQRFAFKLTVNRTQARTYTLYTTTHSDADRWVSALRAASEMGAAHSAVPALASKATGEDDVVEFDGSPASSRPTTAASGPDDSAGSNSSVDLVSEVPVNPLSIGLSPP